MLNNFFPSDAAYVGLGGNFTSTLDAFIFAIEAIKALPYVKRVQTSQLYLTSPISSIPQNSFFNAICKVDCQVSVEVFFQDLALIEKKIGKIPKPKESPRLIDLDLLFFYNEKINTQTLILPHPRWHERLFVLAPLAELIPISSAKEIEKLLEFTKQDKTQQVDLVQIKLPYQKEFL